jgi:hypothetical protein
MGNPQDAIPKMQSRGEELRVWGVGGQTVSPSLVGAALLPKRR